jgi:hypothetical protein
VPARSDDAEALRRLGGGRWQTRDERFTVEPQSGQWVVVDAEQTDELGLPRVRGPFSSLTRAKEAIAEARTGDTPTSPLADRIARLKRDAKARPEDESRLPSKPSRGTKKTGPPPLPPEPPEPNWIADLLPAGRMRARRLLEHLKREGVDDPEDLVREDLVDDKPRLASYALERDLRALIEKRANAGEIVALLTSGDDAKLDVGWRLVDQAGRPIRLRKGDLRS